MYGCDKWYFQKVVYLIYLYSDKYFRVDQLEPRCKYISIDRYDAKLGAEQTTVYT